jgi:pimeloyl-ACP methyl ester carboxylesterase
MNSTSKCPDGKGFTTRAPEWLEPHLLESANVAGMRFAAGDFAFFSYSGRWCDGDAFGAADYSASDTCAGIDDRHAKRLRDFIERLGPGRVTIVAHSMGGLVAAYLIGSDEAWARAHIASVATFDSPLRGINLLRTGVLGAGGVFDGDCGLNSDAVRDLWDDSSVVKTAARAASIVPFFTSDATDDEGHLFGLVEAVPGKYTNLDGQVAHARFGEKHSSTWTKAGDDVEKKQRFVACAVSLATARCLDR